MLTAGRAVLLPIAVYAWQVLGAGQPLFASWSVLLVDLLVDTPAFLCSYTSYLLTMASTLVMVPSLSRLLVFGELVIYFEVAARHEERKFAR